MNGDVYHAAKKGETENGAEYPESDKGLGDLEGFGRAVSERVHRCSGWIRLTDLNVVITRAKRIARQRANGFDGKRLVTPVRRYLGEDKLKMILDDGDLFGVKSLGRRYLKEALEPVGELFGRHKIG